MPSAQAIIRAFNNIKTLPHVSIRLSKLISDEGSHVEEFEKIIKLDPTLVLRLLRLVNTPYYGLKEKITSISRAVVFIGMKNLRNLVVIEALKDIYGNGPEQNIFSRSHLWLHCAAVSICSQMISERIFGQKGEDAFLCGIIHDIGMILEHQVAQDLFEGACKTFMADPGSFTRYESEIIGTDHCAVGSLLAGDWKLPGPVKQGILRHHSHSKTVAPRDLAGLVQIAEYIVSRLNYTALPGMAVKLSPSLAAHVRENLEEYKTLARDIPGELEKAKDLYAPAGGVR